MLIAAVSGVTSTQTGSASPAESEKPEAEHAAPIAGVLEAAAGAGNGDAVGR